MYLLLTKSCTLVQSSSAMVAKATVLLIRHLRFAYFSHAHRGHGLAWRKTQKDGRVATMPQRGYNVARLNSIYELL